MPIGGNVSIVRLTIFDLDHTLLTANSSFRFGLFLYRKKVFPIWVLLICFMNYARHKWLGMSIYHLHSKSFSRLFKGCLQSDICRYVDQFLNESLAPMLNDPVVQRLKNAQDRGDHVLILSSSPDFLVKKIAARLQVPHWSATVYKCDEQGNFSTISHVMEGREKGEYLKKLMDELQVIPSEVTVYSDSYLDLPILKMAGKAIAVGPDSHLKRICLQNNWEILT